MAVKGIIPALVTPIDEAERVNEKALRHLLDYTVDNGCHGVFVLSSTGEFYGLSEGEKRRAIEITVDHIHGIVPVMAGAYGVGTKEAIRMVAAAKEAGADLVSVLTPMMITPNDEEIYQHYRAIAESTDLPVTLYNNPDRTHVNLSAKVVERLAEIPNVAAVKDSSGDLGLMMDYIRRTADMDFDVLCGRDMLIFANLIHGGSGSVAATANVAPALLVDLYNKVQQGDWKGALADQYKLAPFRLSFGMASWPAVTKDALNLMGFEVGRPIAPITGCKPEKLEALRGLLEDLGTLQQE